MTQKLKITTQEELDGYLETVHRWQDIAVPVIFNRSNSGVIRLLKFLMLQGKGKKKVGLYDQTRMKAQIVRRYKYTDDEDCNNVEQLITIANNNNCFFAETEKEGGEHYDVAGAITHHSRALRLINVNDDNWTDKANNIFKWHDMYWHWKAVNWFELYFFAEMQNLTLGITEEFIKEIAGIVQKKFGTFEQYIEAACTAYKTWHEDTKNEAYTRDSVPIQAQLTGLIQLYVHAYKGKEYRARTHLNEYVSENGVALWEYFTKREKNCEGSVYNEVKRDSLNWQDVDAMLTGKNNKRDFNVGIQKLIANKDWKKAVEELAKDGCLKMEIQEFGYFKLGDILLDDDEQRNLDIKHCVNIVKSNFNMQLLDTMRCVMVDGKLICIDTQHTYTVVGALWEAGAIC